MTVLSAGVWSAERVPNGLSSLAKTMSKLSVESAVGFLLAASARRERN